MERIERIILGYSLFDLERMETNKELSAVSYQRSVKKVGGGRARLGGKRDGKVDF
jgi:hypothetical protein